MEKKIATILMFLLYTAPVLSIFGAQIPQVGAEATGAGLTGKIVDRGVDTDSNGLFEYLEIGVEVNVTEPGGYFVNAWGLRDTEYNYIDVNGWGEAYLDAGLGYLNISFTGVRIYVSGVNPSYVCSIDLISREWGTIGSLSDVPLSREYSYNEFEAPGAVLTGVITDSGVDTDEDGAYDYLEIGVEVNVSEAGNYMVEAYGLLDSDYRYIGGVGDFQSTYLDVGVQVVYLRFDGTRIYASGLNPTNVSDILLYDKDYNLLGELHGTPLSRMYLYTEFDAPPIPVTVRVGVEVGDWVKYNVTATWLSTDPSAITPPQFEELKKIEWIKVEVQNVSNTYITILLTYHFVNGTETTLPPISADMATQFLTYVIPSNLSEGDVIPGYYLAINGTALRSYAGVSRNVNYINFSISFYGISMTQIMYWDKPTGILCETLMEVSTLTDSYVTTISILMEMTETNMWFHDVAVTSVTASPTTITVGESVAITVVVENKGTEAETFDVAAYYDDTVIGTQTVTSLAPGASETLTFTWDTAEAGPGTYTIKAEASILAGETDLANNILIDGTVTVEKITTALSCSVSKDTITEGNSIVVLGSINATLSGKTVTLTYRKPDGSTLNRTITTGSDGSYSDSYTPDATGSWSVTASWEGDSTHTGATSSSKSFVVAPKPFIETPLGIATVGVGITVVVVAAVVLVLRKRRA